MIDNTIKNFCCYLLHNFLKKEKLFIKNDKYYKLFLFIISNLEISIPTKNIKTQPLNIIDFKIFFNILKLIYVKNVFTNLNESLNIINYLKFEIEKFFQKLYNYDMMEIYFTDISIDLINNDNYYPEFIDLSSLIDNNLDDEYTNIDQEIISDDDSVNEFFL